MSKYLVILDNGHGKNTPGKCSPKDSDGNQIFEWYYCRLIANAVKKRLEAKNIATYLTVPEDVDVALSTRASRANKQIALAKNKGMKSVMVSIHLNAAGTGDWKKATGWEVWSTTSKNNSDKLADCFCNAFKDIFPKQKLRGAKEKNFTVIFKTNCPCVLTENFFMDSQDDYKLLQSTEGFNQIVELHVRALLDYMAKN
jgi:N-acetylmuramoyl-L-alanine amidase